MLRNDTPKAISFFQVPAKSAKVKWFAAWSSFRLNTSKVMAMATTASQKNTVRSNCKFFSILKFSSLTVGCVPTDDLHNQYRRLCPHRRPPQSPPSAVSSQTTSTFTTVGCVPTHDLHNHHRRLCPHRRPPQSIPSAVSSQTTSTFTTVVSVLTDDLHIQYRRLCPHRRPPQSIPSAVSSQTTSTINTVGCVLTDDLHNRYRRLCPHRRPPQSIPSAVSPQTTSTINTVGCVPTDDLHNRYRRLCPHTRLPKLSINKIPLRPLCLLLLFLLKNPLKKIANSSSPSPPAPFRQYPAATKQAPKREWYALIFRIKTIASSALSTA
jgi:hypothetical protein